jgi:acetyl/propionyl-CoA carboxylase alpha subunit
MFGSLLIANRGEIARRVIRTARRLGVRTVAVYSEADAGAPHVREADAAVPIGPAPARESYLAGEKILAAARASGAEAIHPGYGFLSENAAFADAVMAAGLAWVGPPPAAIRAMGLKDAAKALMAKAGVPVTPGYLGEDQDPARLAAEAAATGWPVLIKAVAGGGGKGMRKVERAEDFAEALAGAKREAAAAFGDDRVLIEKYVSRPRHIEVQVFADRYGEAVHLFERDCSLQRRHQKVIEEAPAPGLDEATREALGLAAVRAARAVGYENAGTVEFIADASEGLRADRIWFMEMNTRLQVEHPVTEMITRLDLVEWQLRVACGEPLPLKQAEIRRAGHAVEARLYAENPAAGFLPSVGPLRRLRLPERVRVDAGVEEGGEVSADYDPMIAKLVAFAPTRTAAAASLAEACRQVEAWPVKTNAGFLARALAHPDFVVGEVDTGFIEARLGELLPPVEPPAPVLAAAARAKLGAARAKAGDPHSPWAALQGLRLNGPPHLEVRLQAGGKTYVAAPHGASGEGVLVSGEEIVVFAEGEAWTFGEPQTEAGAGDAAAADGVLRSPLPGRIAAVNAKAGERVARGQPLIVVEAMKMEHALTAPFDGTVAAISVKPGDLVSEGVSLGRLDPLPA